MTGWEVGRTSRTAYPCTVPPTGVFPPMPPHSQGAERRTKRHAGHTGSRWALRALVIGGLAGAAWLLAGAAAHAADREPATGGLLGSSLIGGVVDGDPAPSVLTGVRQAVAQPLESGRPAPEPHRADSSLLSTAPVRMLSAPAEVLTGTLDEVAPHHSTSGPKTALGAVDRVVRELSGPLRLTGGPADSRQLAPVAAPLTPTPRPVTDRPPPAVPAGAQGARSADAPGTGEAVATRTADPGRTNPAEATGRPAAPAAQAASAQVVRTTGSVSKRHPLVTDRHPAAVMAAGPEIHRDTTPDGDGPAPLRVHLGALSGLSTATSGAPTEGGSPAFLPAAVAGSTVAHHRLLKAADVGARRHDAEAPTVSPD